MMHTLRLLGVLAALPVLLGLAAAPAAAEPPSLSLPIACEPGTSCWVTKLVDVDTGPRDADYMCGPRAPGNHKGVDFAVTDMAVARKTAVLAAAPGVVLGVRDEMDDVNILTTGAAAVAGKECGNGLVIDHGDGWHTQYCHMLRGSLGVKPGQRVERGQELGRVGLSGSTELPHLHLSVRKDGAEIDPFTGRGRDGRCGTTDLHPLWDAPTLAALPYEPRRLALVGFAPEPAEKVPARQGTYAAPFDPAAPVLVLWTDILGPRAGDRITFTITGPDGRELLKHTQELPKDHAQWFGYAGLKRKGPAWASGDYQGRVILNPVKGGAPLERAATLSVR